MKTSNGKSIPPILGGAIIAGGSEGCYTCTQARIASTAATRAHAGWLLTATDGFSWLYRRVCNHSCRLPLLTACRCATCVQCS